MKGYVIVNGQFSTTSITELRPTILGIVDPTNYKNVISLRDILMNKRLAATVYNLGLKLIATSYPIRESTQYFGVTYSFRENINTDIYTETQIATDIWDMDEADLSDAVIAQIKATLKSVCTNFDDTELMYVIKKLTSDSYKLLFEQFDTTTNGTEATQYYLQEGTINGDPIKNITVLYPRTVTETVMHSPTDDIPLTVPSFYDLMCYSKYKQAELERDFMYSGTTDDDDDVTEEDITDTELAKISEETNYFSQKEVSYTDIYKPHYSYAARVTVTTQKGIEIPIINPTTVRVQKVTQFWEVYPASQIPDIAFGKKDDNTPYHLNDLTGHPENNHLGLQSNEKRYYNELENLLNVCISIEHNALSEEVFVENADRYSEVLEDYLKTLSEQAFNLLWCHTGTTQSVYPDSIDSEDTISDNDTNDSSANIEVTINLHCHYGTILTVGNKCKFQPFYQNMNANDDLAIRNELKCKLPRLYLGFDGNAESGFVHHNGALVGFIQQNPSNHRWIDTLIRLLRWGERKPTVLSWESLSGEDKVTANKYWNLNTASVSTHDGNIDSHKPIIDSVTGNCYKLMAVVCADISIPKGAYEKIYGPSKYEGGSINVHVPIGVKLQVNYEEENMHKIVYEDIFTYHEKIKNGNPDDARGHIVYDGSDYIDITKAVGMIIPEEDLNTTVQCIDVKTYSGHTDDNKEVLLVFNVNSNLEIAEKRRDIISKFTDVNAAITFRDQVASKNLFNSIQQFTIMAAQANCLLVGKKFAETLSLGSLTGSLGINPENARIVYTFLNRLCDLSYNPVMLGNTPACDLKAILTKLDKPAERTETVVLEQEDPCWVDFKNTIGANPAGFVFCELKAETGILPVAFAITRDKANKLFVFMTHDELDYLRKKYTNSFIIKTMNYEQKYKNAFVKAVMVWNAAGKNIDKCKHSNMIIASNKAMQVISDVIS